MQRLLLSIGLVLCVSGGVQAQVLEDLTLVIDRGAASEVQVDTSDPVGIDFVWRNVTLMGGRGPLSVGLTFMDTDNQGSRQLPKAAGFSDQNLVLNAAYTRPLGWYARLEVTGNFRLATWQGAGLQIRSTYSRMQANAVFYHPDGVGWLRGAPLFPSAYVGSIVNEFGRAQGLVGVGTWWKGLGIYGVGFYSFNGEDNPLATGKLTAKAFGLLRDAGVNVSASYTWRDLTLEVRRNIPFRNGANIWNLQLKYRYFLQ
ncbi:MAG: hypothetical protein AAGI71_18755 [Bacteroidota bacterium]